MQTRIKEQQKGEKFTLTHEQVEFFRQAPVVWDQSESGAPIIAPAALLSRTDLGNLHTALQVMLRCGGIQPGIYMIPNRLKDMYETPAIQADSEGNTLEIPQHDVIEFNLTEQHIKLLHHANADSLAYFGACGLNSRHPYGEMTFWEIDAAHILGVPVYRDQNGSPSFTKQELALFHSLHRGMLFALAVYLAHAKIEPGEFVRRPSDCPSWERISQLGRGSTGAHRILRQEGKHLRLRGSW